MQIRLEQLEARLARGLDRVYVIHGDEPLLAQEAADAVRAAARAAGHDEREVFTVAGAHFDWSAVRGAAQAMGLFSSAKIIEIRIPSGKPGKDGSEEIQRYVEALGEGVLTLVMLPRLDGQQLKSAWFAALDGAGVSIRLDPVERRALPAWLAQRLARQNQRAEEGEAGQRMLAFFADRVEGNLLAAHQELQKLALLHPQGVLTFEQVHDAVLDVARYDTTRLADAVWSARTDRALRMLDALQAEGESAVRVHWTLAEDVRSLARARAALDAGQPMPMALREARAWGPREKAFERVLPALDARRTAAWLHAAQVCDGIVKGLPHPQWPAEPWGALRHFLLVLLQGLSPAPAPVRLALRG